MRQFSEKTVRAFRDESGTATVDFVVLAGVVIALAVGVVASVERSLENSALDINQRVESEIDLDADARAQELDELGLWPDDS